ncbi:hypothetical protein L1049_002404 [Liquidambar formosana]|uniref:Zinc finger CCCH domain-containing protein 41 n=1 Tax=Liquidambar formosana TaxID=63359 RepID=A0AAP0NFL1_LIQFO
MELKVSSPKPGGLSPSDCASDPEEKEFSDDDDDDRNHKHRRRETRSQSLERDSMEQVLSRPYRKRNKPFENGHSFRESDSQSNESWKNYNIAPIEKDFPLKFDRRRPGLSTFPRAPLDLNQRIRINQSFPGDSGPGRGRGRDSGSWNQRDSRFSTVDPVSQAVHQGSIPPGLFAGRGLPNVSNPQGASWNTFGLIPGIPNGGLDTLHSLGLQGTLRPPINPSLNMGIPRQRCRDFEERGFCLRGDMCPMEHGVNRIVVEDVQSLSQFNLPVSLPSAHLLGTPAGPGPLTSVAIPSSALMNSKGLHSKSSKPGMADDGLGLNGAFSGSTGAGGGDLYDPDQPLWNNDCPETSTALLALHSPKIDETESLLDGDPSDHAHARLYDNADSERPLRSTGTAIGSHSTSVWGRIGGSKSRSEVKEKINSAVNSSDHLDSDAKEDREALSNVQGPLRQGKRIIVEDIGVKATDSSVKTQSDTVRNSRKPSQKALRTLFVNGIPQKNNKREALLSHFRKFGEIIDIYIPLNSERAFVQFSKREEAEAALKAPDAVMGNRFIKLWWANRDSIPDDGMSSGCSVSVTPCGVTTASVPPQPSVANPSVVNRGKDNLQSAVPKVSISHASDAPVPACDQPKPVVMNGPKPPPPLQKKLESLELLKEELRKKQEMLDLKRNTFRRQLDKLQKQTTGLKGEVATEQAVKRHKVGTTVDVAKVATPRSTDPGTVAASPRVEKVVDMNKSADNVVSPSSKAISAIAPQELASLKQPIRPLASVADLKEHFSSYGDLSTVELEDLETGDGGNGSEVSKSCSARIAFSTRRSAETAFINGKIWQGHNLQFMWLASNNSGNDLGGKENSPSAPKGPWETDIQPAGNLACNVSQEAAVSGDGEFEKSDKTKSSVELMGPDEVSILGQP